MSILFDKNTLLDWLKTSNLNFITSGILKVDDPLFITKWTNSSEEFKSETIYTKLNSESFIIPTSMNFESMSWNHFGFNQSFSNDEYLNAPYHRNKHIEIHYVKTGEFKLKLNREYITLNEGDICIINPETYHSDIMPNGDLELFIIGINEELLDKLDKAKKYDLFDSAFKSGQTSEYIYLSDAKVLETNIKDLVVNIKEDNVDKFLAKLLSDLFKLDYHLIIDTETSRNTMLYDEISLFINRNYQSVTLDDLEFYFNFSKDHISRIIKSESGLSFVKYTQRIRIEKAKELLLNTDYSINEIMKIVGYKNETHFYKVFKDLVHLSPNEYREA